MSQEENDLATHVNLCHLRYQQLQEKIDGLEQRLTKVENTISAIKSDMHTGFSEIKLLLEKQNNARAVQLMATISTVGAALITAVFLYLK
jgi:predicted  nucleic acid-binding Zn-ribbon protein